MRLTPWCFVIATTLASSAFAQTADPNLYFEEVRGTRAMEWVNAQNARSTGSLEKDPLYTPLRTQILEVLTSKERIPAISKHGSFLYNFWRDDKHPRGLWRRTTLDEYKKPVPAWETVVDLDALSTSEKENWVWGGVDILEPECRRCLVSLSRGGGDAEVVREFDLEKKAFIADGFTLPEAKSRIAWADENTLMVGTDFGKGSLTTSGYPRIIKQWKRGTPLSAAATVFEGKPDDMSVGVAGYYDHGTRRLMLDHNITFFTGDQYLRSGDQWVKIDKPGDVEANTFGDKLLFRPRTDWKLGTATFKGGSLLVANLSNYLKGDRHLDTLFEPTAKTALASVQNTRNFLILNTLDNVASQTFLFRDSNGTWQKETLPTVPLATVSVDGLDENESDDLLISTTGYLTPPTLSLGNATAPDKREVLKQLPAFFDTANLQVQQFEATSADGTKVPYFLVGRKNLPLDGNNPTLLYGYGGFQISMRPGYSPEIGRAWLAKGGTYVVANIRGGGEFGPAWHYAARKEHRQRAYDDFISVAQDLITRKVTSPPRLGIIGRSNGGLLMGVMLTERPDLWGAVIIGSPLLDMQRYTLLPAGASWIDEYGDPAKPDELAYITKYSPYQNIKPGTNYPPIMVTTSTMDDRVHPGHARKFAARLLEAGVPESKLLYYENTEGGHAAAANYDQQAHMRALEYTFLWRTLGAPAGAP